MTIYDALLGRVFSHGTELELAGGLDFLGDLSAARNAVSNRIEVTAGYYTTTPVLAVAAGAFPAPVLYSTTLASICPSDGDTRIVTLDLMVATVFDPDRATDVGTISIQVSRLDASAAHRMVLLDSGLATAPGPTLQYVLDLPVAGLVNAAADAVTINAALAIGTGVLSVTVSANATYDRWVQADAYLSRTRGVIP